MQLAIGDVLEGKVTGITKFGAFVKLDNNTTGLVHISEVADTYVKEISDFLNVGDTVTVKVVNIGDNGKIGLSIKQAKPEPQPKAAAPSPKAAANTSFEDKLALFMKDSNEKLIALKRHQEGRKGRK